MKRKTSVDSSPPGAELDHRQLSTMVDDGDAVGGSGKSVPYLVCLNALVCGIEFSSSAGFAYIPPLLLKIGLSETVTTCLLGVGPFLALGAVPLIGRSSDRCQSKFGRRRPFILAFSTLLLLSLLLVPFGLAFGVSVLGSRRVGVLLTTAGVVLLDFSCLAGFNPCESLVSDTVRGTEYVKRGFMVYSCMLSFGGCIGYLISAVDWSDTYLNRFLKNQEQMAFSVIFVLVLAALVTTMAAAKERPYMSASTHAAAVPDLGGARKKSVIHLDISDDVGYETGSSDSLSDETADLLSRLASAAHTSPTRRVALWLFIRDCPQRVLSRLTRFLRQTFFILLLFPRHIVCTPLHLARRLVSVPTVLRRLFLADLCSWAALLCHNMFYTDYIAQAVFAGNPNAADGTLSRRAYDAGVRMGSWGLLWHSITACVYAGFLQDAVIRHFGMARAYFVGLLVFGLCMVAILASTSIAVISLCTAVAGLGFAAITTIPNTLVTTYHADKELYFFDCSPRERGAGDGGGGEERGIGADIAVINSAYFLGQIIVSVVVGPLVDATRSVTVYMAVSAVCAFAACFFATHIVFTPSAVRQLQDRGAAK